MKLITGTTLLHIFFFTVYFSLHFVECFSHLTHDVLVIDDLEDAVEELVRMLQTCNDTLNI